MQLFIERPSDDANWLMQVHKIPPDILVNGRYYPWVCAILYGNEDCPSKVELFRRNHYKCKPVTYENGDLVLS